MDQEVQQPTALELTIVPVVPSLAPPPVKCRLIAATVEADLQLVIDTRVHAAINAQRATQAINYIVTLPVTSTRHHVVDSALLRTNDSMSR